MEHREKPRWYLLYSTEDFLNEALSYKIGHLHEGTDAKWFFNINTTPVQKQTSYFMLGQHAEEALWCLEKTIVSH